jgi:uncharacterized protein YndB with AHSA1/START domain
MSANVNAEALDTRELTITRMLDAPRELVFTLWTEPQHLSKWWGPKGFTNPVCEVDARPGGALYIVMRAPNGAEHPMKAIYREVVAPERLVFTSVAVGAADEPLLDALTTVTFEDADGRTRLTLHTRATALVTLANRMLEGMDMGWTQSIDRLESLASVMAVRPPPGR